MTDDRFELTRRKALAGLGAVGAASVGAGLGTSAYFSDEERFDGNKLVAGALDLKVAWSEHYSDWSEDESAFLRMAESASQADLVLEAPDDMPGGRDILLQFVTDRRDWQGFLSTTTQEIGGNLTGDPCEQFLDVPNDLDAVGNERPVVQIEDVKPGDFGLVCTDLVLCDNPGYLWMNGTLLENAENGIVEPERDDSDEDGDTGGQGGELADIVQTIIWYEIDALDCWPNENISDEIIFQGSLNEAMTHLSSGNGIPLDGDLSTPYDELTEPGTDPDRDEFIAVGSGAGESAKASLGFLWYLPIDHANEIQTDRVAFDLGFYTEQARHNDGGGLTTEASVTFDDQTSNGNSVVVNSVRLPEGGYVVIHESTSGGTPGTVIGHSGFLGTGTHSDVTVSLDQPISADQRLIAMAHMDDGDRTYEFGQVAGADVPYTRNGSPVIDAAMITVSD